MPIARRVPRTGLLLLSLAAAVGAVACANPPDKEIYQAVGAIEAARAAGAEQYAPDELAEAVSALERARSAVDQRDFRLALNHALDARERAGDAARGAAAHRAEAQSRADVLVALVSQRLGELRVALDAARDTRVPVRGLAGARRTADRADAALQEARAALAGGEYGQAAAALEGLAEKLQTAAADVENAVTERMPGRRS